jgi:hypothetical protein
MSDIVINPLEFMTVTTDLSLLEGLKKKYTSPMVLKLTAIEIIHLHYSK